MIRTVVALASLLWAALIVTWIVSENARPQRDQRLARVVRGRFLALREEDFITAAELDGCGRLSTLASRIV